MLRLSGSLCSTEGTAPGMRNPCVGGVGGGYTSMAWDDGGGRGGTLPLISRLSWLASASWALVAGVEEGVGMPGRLLGTLPRVEEGVDAGRRPCGGWELGRLLGTLPRAEVGVDVGRRSCGGLGCVVGTVSSCECCGMWHQGDM